MKATIVVEPLGKDEFLVAVSEGPGQTSHRVTVQPQDYERITSGKIGAAELVKVSFEFLLEHEPKEMILRQFDLMVIARYFPAFERELKHRLSRS